ncbi:hypothetical protein [Serratia liquefaciens]|uniref:hypothetical protein n=1 Tax=Serratia liquefaciens TaxID=614 RepID=UPI0021582159|nr:hypothetical protein [Serratia liquefaciens]
MEVSNQPAHIYISHLYTTSVIKGRVSGGDLKKTLRWVANSDFCLNRAERAKTDLGKIKDIFLGQRSKRFYKKSSVINKIIIMVDDKRYKKMDEWETKIETCLSDMTLFRNEHAYDFGASVSIALGKLSTDDLTRIHYLNRPGESDS